MRAGCDYWIELDREELHARVLLQEGQLKRRLADVLVATPRLRSYQRIKVEISLKQDRSILHKRSE